MFNLDEFVVVAPSTSAGRNVSTKPELNVYADGKISFSAYAQTNYGLTAGTNLCFLTKGDGKNLQVVMLKGDKRGHIIKGNAEKKSATMSDAQLAKKLIEKVAADQGVKPAEVKKVKFTILDHNDLQKNLYGLDIENAYADLED